MAWQLVYTSAPRLLDAGRSGFGTVARHRAIPSLLVQAVERFSQFARLPGMDPNRVIYSHRVVPLSGSRYHVLSMIRSAGSDYTGRTNHIAHHLIITDREAAECATANVTPADVLIGYKWLNSWEQPPRVLDDSEQIHLSTIPRSELQYSAWGAITGNPEHALLLVTNPASTRCRLLAPAGTDFRFLFVESLRWQMATSWQVTFTTAEDPNDDPGDFRWIVCPANSRPTTSASDSSRPVLDLTRTERLPIPEVPPQTIEAPAVEIGVPSPSLRKLGQYAEPAPNQTRVPTAKHQGPANFQIPPPTFFRPSQAPAAPQMANPAPPARKPSSNRLYNITRASALLLGTALALSMLIYWWPSSHPTPKNSDPPHGADTRKEPPPPPAKSQAPPEKPGLPPQKEEVTKASPPTQEEKIRSVMPEQLARGTKPEALAQGTRGAEPSPSTPSDQKPQQDKSKISQPSIPSRIYLLTEIQHLDIPLNHKETQITALLKGDADGVVHKIVPKGANYFLDAPDMQSYKPFFKDENSSLKTFQPMVEGCAKVKELIIASPESNATAFVIDSNRLDRVLLPDTYHMTLKNGKLNGDIWKVLQIKHDNFLPKFKIQLPAAVIREIRNFLPDEIEFINIRYPEEPCILNAELMLRLENVRKMRSHAIDESKLNQRTLNEQVKRDQQLLDIAKKGPPDKGKSTTRSKIIAKGEEDLMASKDKAAKNLDQTDKLIKEMERINALQTSPFLGHSKEVENGPSYDSYLYVKSIKNMISVQICKLSIKLQ